jgi:hypothetical protein
VDDDILDKTISMILIPISELNYESNSHIENGSHTFKSNKELRLPSNDISSHGVIQRVYPSKIHCTFWFTGSVKVTSTSMIFVGWLSDLRLTTWRFVRAPADFLGSDLGLAFHMFWWFQHNSVCLDSKLTVMLAKLIYFISLLKGAWLARIDPQWSKLQDPVWIDDWGSRLTLKPDVINNPISSLIIS